MFLLKKIVAPLFFPLPVCLELLAVGLFLLWFTRRQKAGKIVVSVATGLLALLSLSFTGRMLLAPLEREHAPVPSPDPASGAKHVLVLAGAHVTDPRLPLTSQLGSGSLVRLVEGIRLYRRIPGATLILSGGRPFDPVATADVMAQMARELGVPASDIRRESASRDTKDQARLLAETIGDAPFYMVTSASHMPRAVALFRKQGLRPIPAPTGHTVRRGGGWSPALFYPSPGALCVAHAATYEYLGLAWAWLRGQI
jgi:uncharacterized SAM-binding protein YcdF (DUF218 family)